MRATPERLRDVSCTGAIQIDIIIIILALIEDCYAYGRAMTVNEVEYNCSITLLYHHHHHQQQQQQQSLDYRYHLSC